MARVGTVPSWRKSLADPEAVRHSDSPPRCAPYGYIVCRTGLTFLMSAVGTKRTSMAKVSMSAKCQ